MTGLSKAILDDITYRAVNEGRAYSSWSRAILHGLQKYFEFITDDMVRAAVALAGGGARATIGSCGAFSGGLMALSAKLSPGSEEPTEKEMEEFDKVRFLINEFRDWFFTEFGSVVCRDVQQRQLGQSFNLMDDKERQAFRDFPQVHEKCSQVYSKAVIKVAEILSRDDIG